MSDTAPAVRQPSSWRNLIWALVPIAVMAAAIAWIVLDNPLRFFDNGAPPVEALTFERTILDENGIRLLVRAGGSEPMRIGARA